MVVKTMRNMRFLRKRSKGNKGGVVLHDAIYPGNALVSTHMFHQIDDAGILVQKQRVLITLPIREEQRNPRQHPPKKP